MKLQIGCVVQCISTVKPKGVIKSFTKLKTYNCIDGGDEYSNCLIDDTDEPHEVGEDNGELGEWFNKHFILL